jgi:uncharacterized membrane protein YcgQ (UPF0703/DUF1980 family)
MSRGSLPPSRKKNKRNENICCVPRASVYTNNMNKQTEEQYKKNWVAVNNGTMTEQEWMDYTWTVLTEVLEDCKDVMVRLKYM